MIENMILIGSRALEFRAPSLLKRRPLDFDFICTKEAFKVFYDKFFKFIDPKKLYSPTENKIIIEGKTICEFEIIQPGSTGEKLLEMVSKDGETLRTDFGFVPMLNVLFSLKKSHRFLKDSPHFYKTFIDYHLMKSVGCRSDPYHDWFLQREKETYAKQKHPKLDTNKKEFFNEETFKYELDHDSIHVAMSSALLGGAGEPAYVSYGEDGEEVKSSKKKFFEVSEQVRLRGALEETMVLACERSLQPHPGKLSEKQAFLVAYSKLASSISSGWFREYVYENGPQIIASMPQGYGDHFQNCVKNGAIKPFKTKE